MLASNVVMSSALNIPNIPNFSNLVLFICQLFIDGNFRIGHILYDPTVFDGRLLTEIEMNCPNQWKITDITKPSISPWNPENTDDILQLIFFDPNNLSEKIYLFNEYSTHHQIFAFCSNDESDIEKPLSIIGKLNPISLLSFSTLVLHFDTDNGMIHINWIPNILTDGNGKTEKKLSLDSKAISVRNQNTDIDRLNLFDQTFGKYEEKHKTAIISSGWIEGNVLSTELATNRRKRHFTNYYLLALNTFMRVRFIINSNIKAPPIYQNYMLKQHKFYKELFYDYKS